MIILSVNPASLPNQPVSMPVRKMADTRMAVYGNARLMMTPGLPPVIQVQAEPTPTPEPQQAAAQPGQEKPKAEAPAAAQNQDKQSFWERVFNVQPTRARLEKALAEKWKFTDVRPRQLEFLLTPEEEDTRRFFLDNNAARQYRRLVQEFGVGFENRNGAITDDSLDTLSEYGQELVGQYTLLIDHKDIIKKYYGGLFRDNRIGAQTLIRISNSMWFGPFAAPKFRQYANLLHNKFQVPDHVIGPMLGSVGDSFWLPRVLFRKTGVQEFQQLLKKIAPSVEGSANAFAPALQLLVIGEEHKLPFKTLDNFVENLRLRPQDFGPFSAVIYNLGAYRLADEIKCPTFANFLRRELDEFGPDINQESGRLFVHAYREFKDNNEAIAALQSPQYSETKNFLKTVGTVSSSVWNMERIAVLTQTLTPEKRAKVTQLARELSSELTVADIMFLADISANEEEVKLLLNREALLQGVKDINIDRIVERSNNDLVKELEREIDIANRNGLHRTVRKLMNMVNEEKRVYSERVDPNKLSNIQLSRLLIFHRSISMPGFLDTVGWNVSLDIQNERSEGGGYLGYDKDMAMVTMVAGQPGDNRAYRPVNLDRASASLALFHNHAFKDTFTQRYLSFLSKLWPGDKNKDRYAGPSGWLGAEKGDITAAALSELPSFIITKVGHPKNPDGSEDRKKVSVNFDWVIVDQQNGEAMRSDRGVFTVPFYGDEQLGKLKWPSGKEMKRREKERREKCPPLLFPQTATTAPQQ